MNIELLAIVSGFELFETLRLSGTVCCDCQGIVKKPLHPHLIQPVQDSPSSLTTRPHKTAEMEAQPPRALGSPPSSVGPKPMGNLPGGPFCPRP